MSFYVSFTFQSCNVSAPVRFINMDVETVYDISNYFAVFKDRVIQTIFHTEKTRDSSISFPCILGGVRKNVVMGSKFKIDFDDGFMKITEDYNKYVKIKQSDEKM